MRKLKRSMYGGSGAWPWVESNYGNETTQLANTFGHSNSTGNSILPVPGAHALNQYKGFSSSSATVGGRRRKRRKRTKKNMKGGFWGSAINTALVPLTLLTMQQTLGRKKRRGRRRGSRKR